MKKKVLFISESMSGGLRKHIVQLIKNLDKDKYDLFFIHGTTTLDAKFQEEYEDLKTKANIIPYTNFTRRISLRNDIKTFIFISKKIKEIQPDIVHCHSSKAGVIGRIAAKRRRINRVFYTPHAYSFMASEFTKRKQRLFILIEAILSRVATTKTFNVSKNEKEEALNKHLDKDSKFEVIYNGLPAINFLNKDEMKRNMGFKATDVIIGNNARMSDQKDPKKFISIAEKVIEQTQNVFFVWAGDGPYFSEIEEYLTRNDLSSRIILLGDRDDTEIIVNIYDIFLLTSKYEGLPYSLIEAMRAGVPIISTNFRGITEIIEDGTGFISNSHQEAILYIDKILKTDCFDSDLITAIFKEKFSLDKMLNKIESYYENEEIV